MDISVIIAAGDELRLLKECVCAADIACAGLEHELIVVDNASRDGTSDWLTAAYPRTKVLWRGRRAPVVGVISMDAIAVDITAGPSPHPDEEFVLLGRQGDQVIGVGELARRRNTIAWEVLSGMAPRLARVYHSSAGTAPTR